MPIYDIFDTKSSAEEDLAKQDIPSSTLSRKDRFFSSLTARLLFFLLLIADLFWFVYALTLFVLAFSLHLLTLHQTVIFPLLARKQWLALKRSSVCALALFISLFSPALGIMIACTYFLMYDKRGIQEVVPASLQEQFQEFMR